MPCVRPNCAKASSVRKTTVVPQCWIDLLLERERMSSSGGCDGNQTWEDAECEFFSEAFLNNKTATTSSMVSLSTEDDLATIAENSNGGVPGATSSLLSKASSRYEQCGGPSLFYD